MVKAQDFDSCIRVSESRHPSQKKALARASAFFNEIRLRRVKLPLRGSEISAYADVKCAAAHEGWVANFIFISLDKNFYRSLRTLSSKMMRSDFLHKAK